MPNTPHSSRSVSPSRSSCSSNPAGGRSRWSWAFQSGFWVSSIAPLFGLNSTRRGFLDQLFQALTSRFTVAIAAARRLLLGISLIIIWFVFLESLQDGVLGVIRQERHQPIPGSLEHNPGLGPGNPFRTLLVRHQPGEEQEG